MPAKILAFAGSLRKDSFNKKLIHLAAESAKRAGAEVTLIDLKDFPLPIFDEDIERDAPPENAKKLKAIFLDHDALLLACPEYNSSITAVLKNTLDWVSRPVPGEPGLACFLNKTAALLAASTGALGGLRGLVTVRSVLSNINVLVLPSQFTLPKAHEALTPDGALKDAKQISSLDALVKKLVDLTGKIRG